MKISKVSIRNRILTWLSRWHILSNPKGKHTPERTIGAKGFRCMGRWSSSNNMIELVSDDAHYFFRPCKPHQSGLSLLKRIIDDYEHLTGQTEQMRYIRRHLTTSNAARSHFLNMGSIEDHSSACYTYLKYGDPSLLGFSDELFRVMPRADFDLLVHYAWSEIQTARQNSGTKGIQFFHYNRSKCQEELYRLFHVERLICPSALVRIQGEGEHLGTISKCAPGVNPLQLNPEEWKAKYAPSLEKELDILHFMDVLCHEKDHRPGNYNIVFDEYGRASSIVAFDNDSPLSFFPTCSIQGNFIGCTPLIYRGTVQRKHFEAEFALTFLEVREEEVRRVVRPYLNKLQTKTLLSRFRKMQQALRRTINSSPSFLVPSDGWNNIRRDNAEGSAVLTTYLDRLITWDENSKDAVQLKQGALPLIPVRL